MPKQIDPTDTIAIGFQVQYQLDDGRGLAFSSCLDADCTTSELNASLDKMMDAAARQQARVKLPRLKKELERLQMQQERAKEDMFRLDAEAEASDKSWRSAHAAVKRGEFRYSPAQLNENNKRSADRQNAATTFTRMEEEIRFRLSEIEELEILVAPSSAANSKPSS